MIAGINKTNHLIIVRVPTYKLIVEDMAHGVKYLR
jgi:hypothetical protein